jgi:hypothetical protein
MAHDGLPMERSIEDQGSIISFQSYSLFANEIKLPSKLPAQSANGLKYNATTHLESAPRATQESLLQRQKVNFRFELKLSVQNKTNTHLILRSRHRKVHLRSCNCRILKRCRNRVVNIWSPRSRHNFKQIDDNKYSDERYEWRT